MQKQKPARTLRQKIIRRTLFAFLGLFALLVIVILDAVIQTYLINGKPLPPPKKFITANPVNLSQIGGISKFRSCQGHEYSGKGPEGIVESNRSMKHYIAPKEEIRDKLGVIEIFAPFDGKLVFVLPEGKGAQLIISPEGEKNWGLIIFHVDRLPGIKVGSKLKSGQLIGHANVKDRHDFDIALTYTNSSLIVENIAKLLRGSPLLPLPKDDYLVSAFDYMTDEVRAQFTAAGFKLDEMQYSRKYRDGKFCDFEKSSQYPEDWQYLPGQNPFEKQKQQQQLPQPDTSNQNAPSTQPPSVLYPAPPQ